jgi:hypothetical protein
MPPVVLRRGYPSGAKLVLPPLVYSHRGYPTCAKLEMGRAETVGVESARSLCLLI